MTKDKYTLKKYICDKWKYIASDVWYTLPPKKAEYISCFIIKSIKLKGYNSIAKTVDNVYYTFESVHFYLSHMHIFSMYIYYIDNF